VLARAEDAQVHLRRTPQDDKALDLAFSVQAMRDDKERFPAFSLAADTRIDALAYELKPGFDLDAHVRKNGISGEARQIVLEPQAGGRMVLSGPIKIGADGLVDGQLRIEASQIASLGAFFTALFPQDSDTIANIANLLSSLETPVAENGDAATGRSATVTLTIRRGAVSFGLIGLGRLPPLF
jgi:hypothetical protein